MKRTFAKFVRTSLISITAMLSLHLTAAAEELAACISTDKKAIRMKWFVDAGSIQRPHSSQNVSDNITNKFSMTINSDVAHAYVSATSHKTPKGIEDMFSASTLGSPTIAIFEKIYVVSNIDYDVKQALEKQYRITMIIKNVGLKDGKIVALVPETDKDFWSMVYLGPSINHSGHENWLFTGYIDNKSYKNYPFLCNIPPSNRYEPIRHPLNGGDESIISLSAFTQSYKDAFGTRGFKKEDDILSLLWLDRGGAYRSAVKSKPDMNDITFTSELILPSDLMYPGAVLDEYYMKEKRIDYGVPVVVNKDHDPLLWTDTMKKYYQVAVDNNAPDVAIHLPKGSEEQKKSPE